MRYPKLIFIYFFSCIFFCIIFLRESLPGSIAMCVDYVEADYQQGRGSKRTAEEDHYRDGSRLHPNGGVEM